MSVKGVIFDLDGVIVSTDEYHYLAWQRMSDEEGIYFDREINHRLRGVSRMDCVEIILERASRPYTPAEKSAMADRKNGYYVEMLGGSLNRSCVLAGVEPLLAGLKSRGIRVAIGSSSRNSPIILRSIGMENEFDAVADGNDISKSKPDPEVFLIAASRLGVKPEVSVVVEDAEAGVEAAVRAGMRVIAVGNAAGDRRAGLSAPDLSAVTVDDVMRVPYA